MPGTIVRHGVLHRSARSAAALSVSVLIVLFLVRAGAVSARPQQALPPAKPLRYDVAVTLKLIQVYVTDKNGKPVRDLTREDFSLFDSGRPVALTAFEKHDFSGAPAAEAAPAPAPAAEQATPPALNRKFVILFDFAFNSHSGVRASIDAVRHFLDTEVRPGDEVAFVSYSMLKGLRIREFLTSDHAKVRAALAAVSTKDIAGRADEVEQAYWMQVENPGLGGAESVQRLGLSQIDMARQDSMQQAGKYFREISRLAQALRLVEGQKNVLFFSNGIPSSLVNASRGVGTSSNISGSQERHGGSAPIAGSTFQVGNYELRPLQEAMFKEFSSSNCSIFAFDTRESSKIPALFTYDEMAFLNRPSSGLLGADSGGVFRDDKTTGMDSLKSLSKQTGGKYYSNILLHEQNLDEVSMVTGTYYVLGFPIRPVPDGRFHEVKVEVKRQDCQVRTQPGYYAPKPFTEYSDIEKSIHLFDLALNEHSEFQDPQALAVAALSYDAGQGGRARVLARLPAGLWTQFAGQTLELVALFFDAQDALLSLQRLALSRADYGGREIVFTAGTPARPGPTKCRIVLRDLETGQSAVGSTTVYTGSASRQGVSVYSPLLLAEGGGQFLLEGVIKGADERPSWQELYPYNAASFSPILGGEAVNAGRIAVALPFSAPGLDGADLIFRANLVSAAGQTLDLPLDLGEIKTQGLVETRRLEIALENVPNGAYTLYIHVGNRISGQVASVRAPLTVAR